MAQDKEQELYQNIIWRSRRGMLELDLLLDPFVRNVFPKLETRLKQAYGTLLKQEDTDLYQWLALAKQPPQDHAEIIALIRKNAKEHTP